MFLRLPGRSAINQSTVSHALTARFLSLVNTANSSGEQISLLPNEASVSGGMSPVLRFFKSEGRSFFRAVHKWIERSTHRTSVKVFIRVSWINATREPNNPGRVRFPVAGCSCSRNYCICWLFRVNNYHYLLCYISHRYNSDTNGTFIHYLLCFWL